MNERIAAVKRIREAIGEASVGHGRFSAWITRPDSKTLTVTLNQLYNAIDGNTEAVEHVRRVAELLTLNNAALTSWGGPAASYIVSISPSDLLALAKGTPE